MGAPEAMDTPEDAGFDATDAEADVDASMVLGCACDPDERFEACFAKIGTCCYGDPTLGGRALDISSACEAQPACKACCRECAEASCDTLVETNSCPAKTN